MRLLYLSCDPGVPVLGNKGASVHVREMVRAFAALGASVLVASPRVQPEGDHLGDVAELIEIDGIRPTAHRSARSLRQSMAAQAEQVAAIAKDRRVDAIYERLALFGASGIEAAAYLDVPHILEVNAPLSEEALRFRSLPHSDEAFRTEARVCASTDHAFAVSEAMAARLVRGGVAPSKVTVAPNGVDPAKFEHRQQRARRGSRFILGFAGSLKPWHGVSVLLEAFARARRARPSMRLEIIGTGPDRATVAAARVPARTLTDHGALPHAAAVNLMATWDVGVAPFLPMPDFYFSPLKVVEYMAAGICAVASDLGQIRTLLGDGDRGVLVEPGNADALAEAVVELVDDRARAAQLGSRARAFALQSLTWRSNASRALHVLTTSAKLPVSAR